MGFRPEKAADEGVGFKGECSNDVPGIWLITGYTDTIQIPVEHTYSKGQLLTGSHCQYQEGAEELGQTVAYTGVEGWGCSDVGSCFTSS